MPSEKLKIGTMPCEGSRCMSHDKSVPVVVWKSDKGTLSYRCTYCDRAKYARPDSEEFKDWMQDIKPFADPVVVPTAKAPAPAAPAPGKSKSTLFG